MNENTFSIKIEKSPLETIRYEGKIIPEKYFMCFATYDGETLPPFVGDFDVMAWNGDNRITPRTFDKRRLKNE